MIQTVAELVNHLAGLPPMMPVIGWNQDTGVPKFINNAHVINDDGPVAIFRIELSAYAQDDVKIAQSYDEEIAEQRQKALDMGREKKKAEDV